MNNPQLKPWIEGLPEGTTHYSVGNPFNEHGTVFEVCVRAFKYDDDGTLLVWASDNEGEWPEWDLASRMFKKVPPIRPLYCILENE